MYFRQLFEPLSSTCTYLLGCQETGQAVLIDPVINEIERDLAVIHELGLQLVCTLDTHVHADHITAALELRKRRGSLIAASSVARLDCADLPITEGHPLHFGSIMLKALHTPGHTDDHFALATEGRVFTGDALLIDACGRTDFQNGDAETLYRSVTEKLFRLADETLVYPAHDYAGRRVSSIGQEKTRNPRLGGGKSLDDFKRIMSELDLPYPKFIDYALPGPSARIHACLLQVDGSQHSRLTAQSFDLPYDRARGLA